MEASIPNQTHPDPTPLIPTNYQLPLGELFDPSDPALFNFDLDDLDFGTHSGALEFGTLGHMASTDTPTLYQTSSNMPSFVIANPNLPSVRKPTKDFLATSPVG
jgi:hypothetical protein